MSRRKRILSLLLCMVLCFSLLPTLAADAGFEESATQETAAPETGSAGVKNATTEETQYLNKCTSATSYADLVVTSTGYMMTLPCNSDTNSVSESVLWLNMGEKLVGTQLWKNTEGDYWYKVTFNGKTGYVYSGSVSSSAKWNVTVTNVTAPTGNRPIGVALILKGLISSGTLHMTKIGAKIYYDTDTGLTNPLTGTEITTNTTSYSIEGSTLDNSCRLGSLGKGAYNYVIYCTVENHIANAKNMTTVTKTFKDLSKKELYVSHFTVAGGTSAKTYTVTYDANGGADAPKAQTKLKGVDIKITDEIPTAPSGFHFLGWATSKTATKPKYVAGDTYSKDADVTLYAVWQSNTPMVVTNPVNVAVVEGDTAYFSITAKGTDLSYQWYYQKAGSTVWRKVVINGTGETYILTTAARHNGNIYRCKVTEDGRSVYSEAASLTVISKPVVIVQPENVTVAEGNTATFTVSANAERASYKWYYQKPGSSTWKAVSKDGTNSTYSLTTAARHDGYKYRCRITNAAGTVYSKVVSLKVVENPVITAQPKAVTANKGSTVTFKVSVKNASAYTYQWYYLKPGTNAWTKVIKNGTSAEYTIKALTRLNGYKYRCVITNKYDTIVCITTSDSAKLTVK